MTYLNSFEAVPQWLRNNLKAAFPKRPDLWESICRGRLIGSLVSDSWRKLPIDEYPFQLLAAAAQKGDFFALRESVRLGLDPLIREKRIDQSLILVAAESGRAEIVRYLIRRGASANDVDLTGVSALHYAAASGSLETAQILIDAGAELEDYDNLLGVTPLGYAVLARDLDMVRLLLDAGAVAQAEDYLGLAARSGSAELFDFFHAGADSIDYWDEIFNAALLGGSLEMVRHLLRFDELEFGEGLVLSALKSGSARLIDFLLSPEFEKRLGRPIEWNPRGEGMVHAALEGGNPALLRRLLQAGADPNDEFEGTPPLCSLGLFGPIRMAKILLEFGADPTRTDPQGQTVLRIAEKNPDPKFLRFIQNRIKERDSQKR